MAKEKGLGSDSGKRIETNPLVSRLLDAGSENAITLTGFLAPSGHEGHVRLFPGLNNMSRSIEIAESDIVATVELPKSGLGAVAVWVKRDAALHHRLTEKAEACAARTTGAGAGTGLTNVRRSGLRMKVRPEARDTCTCEYICDGTQCVPCTCECLAQPQ
ncbi:hypothetical protein OG883_14895 [Streptomyces sp. NBC_01142]|uniref:hypothetical protein n=1 Tax=Streptomyces sp. NBC_01142 TaxID=2975865 RepID=UPI00225A9536|nr:hypothetical protein [Streptomyces sp. NBC_01142]MCX4821175.1 hypothetical protein [Streptomyces sp. NBC_01142]